MNIGQIEENVQKIIKEFSKETFIYDLLLAYGLPKATISLLKKGNRNLSKISTQVILKKKLFFQEITTGDVHDIIDSLQKDKNTFRHSPRFLIVTDYKTILAVDTKKQDTLDTEILTLPKYFDFFMPWAGLEKSQSKPENLADIKAAEKMAKLYDELLKNNPSSISEQLHEHNVFLSRLLFCFFAEDTGIFEKGLFTNSIASHTQSNGEDLNSYLNKLFEILNTKNENRKNIPDYLQKFPYVNGGLFGNKYFSPQFTSVSRKSLLECGQLNWSEINPDIFGSMIQAVVHPDQRGGMGMHYTSVPNIMKVIEPLFLNDLKEEMQKNFDSKINLEKLLHRISNLQIFDPACGSGNFLIIAYKELRNLEMRIVQQINTISKGNFSFSFSNISLSKFFGIELDDFAHEVAILSLWLAEHQMNMKFQELFGKSRPSLPLREGGNIVCRNATRFDWREVCLPNIETYILGNPPYLGSSMQKQFQKEDMEFVFSGSDNYKKQDYISCWFYKAAQYINKNVACAFVTTNSVTQGTQVEMTWPLIFNLGLEIHFCYEGFKWSNSAKYNAGVICTIIGLRTITNKPKYIFKETQRKSVNNINAYLVEGPNIIVTKRKTPLSRLPKMTSGNKPLDGGHLVFSSIEKNEFIKNFPKSYKYFRKFIGSYEFINGIERWCLWISDEELSEALEIKGIRDRIEQVREFRKSSGNNARNKVKSSHKFEFTNEPTKSQIIVPRVSSERRTYIPMGFLDLDVVIADSAQVIYNPEPYVFAVINSLMHMIWMKTTSGRLKSDFRYSSETCYNTFPLPNLSNTQKESISQHLFNVLEKREAYSEKTLADLYDPEKMPKSLLEAHQRLDEAVERCYRSKPFSSNGERLEYLFNLYFEMNKEKEIIEQCLLI